MEERVRQFNEDARKSTTQTANKGKAIKEIERLRRVLHTNQNYRFTEADKNNLYSAIEVSPSTCIHNLHGHLTLGGAYCAGLPKHVQQPLVLARCFCIPSGLVHLQCTEAYHGGGVLQGWGHQVLRFPSSR